MTDDIQRRDPEEPEGIESIELSLPEDLRQQYRQELNLTEIKQDGITYMKPWVIAAIMTADSRTYTDREKEVFEAIADGKIKEIPDAPTSADIAAVVESMSIHNRKFELKERADNAPGLTQKIINQFIKGFPEGLARHIDDMVEFMTANDWIPKEYGDQLKQRGDDNPVVWGFPVVLILIYSAFKNFSTKMNSFSLMIERKANREYQPNIPDWHDLINIALYDDDVKAQVTDILLDLGIKEEYHNNLFKSAKTVLSTQEIMSLYWRGEIDNTKRDQLLNKAGISGEELDLLLPLFNRIPGIQDLIQMSVREAFNDRVANEFGYDEDFPEEFGEYAEKQGFSADWAERYWRAHWNLPSVQLGYEMLHRGEISRDQLELLLRSADIPEFWRSRLINISHTLFTRVDVRRMHALGVLSTEDVLNEYIKQGYTEENAAMLTEFVIRYNMQGERDLSRSQIENAYNDGMINRRDAEEFILAMGYDAEETDIILDRIELDKQQKLTKQRINILEDQYVSGAISADTLQEELPKLDIEPEQIQIYIDQWTIDREKKIERPSLSTLRRWLKAGIIAPDTFREEMRLQGWGDTYIDLFIQEMS